MRNQTEPTGIQALIALGVFTRANAAQDAVSAEVAGQETDAVLRDDVEPSGKPARSQLWTIVVLFPCFLVFAMMLVDQAGPSVDRSARVTGRHTELVRLRRSTITEHHVTGIDDRGARFDVVVPEDDFDDASVGDEVIVSRSLLSGEVVGVRGGRWSMTGPVFRTVVWSLTTTVFAIPLVLCVRLQVKRFWPTASPSQRNRDRLVCFSVMAISLVATVCWIDAGRTEANLGSADTTVVSTRCSFVSRPVSRSSR